MIDVESADFCMWKISEGAEPDYNGVKSVWDSRQIGHLSVAPRRRIWVMHCSWNTCLQGSVWRPSLSFRRLSRHMQHTSRDSLYASTMSSNSKTCKLVVLKHVSQPQLMPTLLSRSKTMPHHQQPQLNVDYTFSMLTYSRANLGFTSQSKPLIRSLIRSGPTKGRCGELCILPRIRAHTVSDQLQYCRSS